jgi:hypothetical protein
VAEGSLRRLGGGRWQSRDGRFTIEPQSGTWVVVDGEQVDDLGLPLVRGPFRSLNDAREAIDTARRAGPADSPLSARVEEARQRGEGPGEQRRTRARQPQEETARPSHKGASAPKPAPKPPTEPAWLTKLDAAGKRRALEVLRTLEKAGIRDAEPVARSEVVDGQPALARLAIERRIRAALETSDDAHALARAIVDILVRGQDRQLDASWRLVDGGDRPLRSLDVER